jgi:peptide-methionine (S)-S-oxide reductase
MVGDPPGGGFMRLLAVPLILGLAGQAPAPSPAVPKSAVATFAGGCFWCMEGPFESLPGVSSAVSGYAGGQKKNPTYEEVSAGTTGHAEAVEVRYDPRKVSYEKLLEVFWHNIDPFQAGAQFCDRGTQYRSAIFFHDDAQRQAAEASLKQVEERFKKKVATELLPAGPFYRAEEYHQDYYQTNPIRYRMYRTGCGRDRRLKELWGSEAEKH